MKEVKLGQYTGPFKEIPEEFADDFIQFPIGLVSKDDGKNTRLIFHLSYPRNTKDGTPSPSVNANTDKNLCSVKYPDFNDAVRLCLSEGRVCHVSKSDMRSAFRNLRILRLHWRYLIMKACSPITKEWFYFINKCLPFGVSISCAHFQKVSDVVAYLVTHRSGKPVINYLDDYIFVALMKKICNDQMKTFLWICSQINFPVSEEKTVFADTIIVFLGFLIDTIQQIIGVPKDKITRATNMINTILNKKNLPRCKWKMTVLQLQRICSFLNFLGQAIIPGRAFTRRLYSQLSNVNLKLHHHIRITEEMMLDLEMWSKFIKHPSIFCRSFIDISMVVSEELMFYTDSSRNFELGCGGYCG